MKTYKLLQNTSFLLLSKAIYVGSLFIIFTLVVRSFPRYEVNVYSLAIAFNSFVIFLADFGATDLVIRKSATSEKDRLFEILLSGVVVKLVYFLAASIVLYGAVIIMYEDALTRYAIYIFCLNGGIFSFSEYIDGIATGLGRAEVISVFNFIQYSILLALYWVFCLIIPQSFASILWMHALIVAVFLIIRTFWVVRICRGQYYLNDIFKKIRKYFKESPVFGVSAILENISGTYLYIITISLIAGVKNDLGVFQGAAKIFSISYLMGAIVCRSLFAATSLSIKNESETELRLHVQRAFHMMGVVFIFIFILFLNLGDHVMKLFYGDRLPGSEAILSLLIVALPVGFFGFVADALLPAANLQRVKTLINVITLAAAVPIVYFLTKSYGIKGTSISWVIISYGKISFLLLAQYVYFRFIPDYKELWKIGLSAAIVGCCLWFFKNSLPLITSTVLAGCFYILLLFALKEDESITPGLRQKLRLIFLKSKSKEY